MEGLKFLIREVADSRRMFAIKGSDEDFRRGMVEAYRKLEQCSIENGISVIMFTHQSGAIWADMANIVWASGLHVTAAWYVVTESDSALRQGSNVKGTVLLVLRKRQGLLKTSQDDLAWEIQEEVENQVDELAGLNQQAKAAQRDENLFNDADLQMAGYAAALRVLTKYTTINGKEMAQEAIRPRVKGKHTFVDELIHFAVDVANQSLVPIGIDKSRWHKLTAAERFYLKMLDIEAEGINSLDNYQNFAKAFKLREIKPFMAQTKANKARLRTPEELGRSEMGENSQFHQSALRALLYAVMEMQQGVDGELVIKHLEINVPNFFDPTQRELLVDLSLYLSKKFEGTQPEAASAARIVRELIRGQKF